VSVNEQLIDTLKREKDHESFTYSKKKKEKKSTAKHSRTNSGKRKKVRSSTSSRDLTYASPRLTKPERVYKFPNSRKEATPTPESEGASELKIPEPKEHEISRISIDRTEENLKVKIKELDKELEDLNRRYKQALLKSPSEGADLSLLRNELNTLASLMENKSSELYALKRKHQAILREKVFKI